MMRTEAGVGHGGDVLLSVAEVVCFDSLGVGAEVGHFFYQAVVEVGAEPFCRVSPVEGSAVVVPVVCD